MKKHASLVSHSCFGLIHCLYRIRKYLTVEACKTLCLSLVISKLDYGNVMLCGATKSVTNMFQRVINVCARLVTRTPKRAHITPSLIQMHWLPMPQRIWYRTLLLTYKTINGQAPPYMSDVISISQIPRPLRSNDNLMLSVPKFRTETYGRGRFGVTAPLQWNTLPLTLKRRETVQLFKEDLKTYLFEVAYF